MAGSHMIEVAEQLLEKLQREKVDWAPATNNDVYYTKLTDGMSLSITRLSWLPGPPSKTPILAELPDLRKVSTYGYRLDLYEERGPMIGSLAATTADPEYSTLRGIYELAEGEEDDAQDKIKKALDYLKGAEEPPTAPERG